MATSRKLYALQVSAWSERARWALQHHGIAYREIEHVPLLGELALRRIAKNPKPTVPLLVDGDEVVGDSFEIALWADRHGQGAKLFPNGDEPIRLWNERANQMLSHTRARSVVILLDEPEALDESMPPFLPTFMHAMSRPVARAALRYLAKKHGFGTKAEAPKHEDALRFHLDFLQKSLASLPPDRPYLLGDFSYADIVMVTSLQGILPVADRFLRLKPATRGVWTATALVAEYPALFAWRDALYERHRRGLTTPPSPRP